MAEKNGKERMQNNGKLENMSFTGENHSVQVMTHAQLHSVHTYKGITQTQCGPTGGMEGRKEGSGQSHLG